MGLQNNKGTHIRTRQGRQMIYSEAESCALELASVTRNRFYIIEDTKKPLNMEDRYYSYPAIPWDNAAKDKINNRFIKSGFRKIAEAKSNRKISLFRATMNTG